MGENPFKIGSEIEVKAFIHDTPLVVEILSAESFDKGGSSIIFKGLAKAPHTPYEVALKVISHIISNDRKELLRRELKIAAQLAHRFTDGIVPFIGTASVGFHHIIVTKFMKNGNMVQYFRRNPTADRQRLLVEVAGSVSWLHDSANLVHGDLKCENVLISDDETAVLADFGLSTLIEQEISCITTCTDILNLNTLPFAAPELLGLGEVPESGMRRRSKTPQGDVYAFGMLVLQAFTGTRPWPHLVRPETVFLALMARTVHPRPSEDATRAGLTDSWWDVCLKCWTYEPDKRPTMRHVRNMLWALWQEDTTNSSEIPGSVRPHPGKDRQTGAAPSHSTTGSTSPTSMTPPMGTVELLQGRSAPLSIPQDGQDSDGELEPVQQPLQPEPVQQSKCGSGSQLNRAHLMDMHAHAVLGIAPQMSSSQSPEPYSPPLTLSQQANLTNEMRMDEYRKGTFNKPARVAAPRALPAVPTIHSLEYGLSIPANRLWDVYGFDDPFGRITWHSHPAVAQAGSQTHNSDQPH